MRPTLVVVTAATPTQAAAVEEALRWRRGDFPGVRFAVVPDVQGVRLGSGGATLNALLEGLQLLDGGAAALDDALILILHSGGDSQRLPCQSVVGKSWSALPMADDSLPTPFDLLLSQLLAMFAHTTGGVVATSTDVLLHFPHGWAVQWPSTGVAGLGVAAPLALAPGHGVFQVDSISSDSESSSKGLTGVVPVTRFWQKASAEEVAAGGALLQGSPSPAVLLDSGVVFFAPDAAKTLVRLATDDVRLWNCTAAGLRAASQSTLGAGAAAAPSFSSAASASPLRLELYSDILFALAGAGMSHEAYMAMVDGWGAAPPAPSVAAARAALWDALHTTPLYAAAVTGPGAGFTHVGTTPEYMALLTAPEGGKTGVCRRAAFAALAGDTRGVDAGATLFNTVAADASALTIGAGAVIEHCLFTAASADVGTGALVSGLRSLRGVRVAPGIALQETALAPRSSAPAPSFVVSVLAVNDPIKTPFSSPAARVVGVAWPVLYAALGVSEADIWASELPPSSRTLWTARLFPRLPCTGAPQNANEGDGTTPLVAAALCLQGLKAGFLPPPAVAAAWRDAERLSLCDILAQADTLTEVQWRRGLTAAAALARRSLRPRQALETSVSSILRLQAKGDDEGVTGAALAVTLAALPWQTGSASDSRTWLLGVGRAASVRAAAARCLAGHDPVTLVPVCTSSEPVSSAGTSSGRALATLAAGLCCDGSSVIAAQQPLQTALAGACASIRRTTLRQLLSAATDPGTSDDAELLSVLRAAEAATSLVPSFTSQQLLDLAEGYEALAQTITTRCVASAPVDCGVGDGSSASSSCAAGHTALPSLPPSPSPETAWVVAAIPARVDLAGGWSDTPPITLEANTGGLVINAGILVDGARPLGARVRCTVAAPATTASAPAAVTVAVRTLSSDPSTASASLSAASSPPPVVTITSAEDVAAASVDPSLPAALVRACLLASGVVVPASSAATAWSWRHSLSSVASSASPLLLEIETWSTLPPGSGLGGSSVLAAAVLAALAAALRLPVPCRRALVHRVLQVEALLTTGGGWQDQVGGIYGGICTATCLPTLPLTVSEPVSPPSPSVAAAFLASNSVLLYTGQTRLAKDLLQRVLRQWALQEPAVTETVAGLVQNVGAMQAALAARDAAAFGASLSSYWSQKQVMAPGSVPPRLGPVLEVLAPYTTGACLAGAGGGGFLLLALADPPASLSALQAVLEADPRTATAFTHPDPISRMSLHSLSVDEGGGIQLGWSL